VNCDKNGPFADFRAHVNLGIVRRSLRFSCRALDPAGALQYDTNLVGGPVTYISKRLELLELRPCLAHEATGRCGRPPPAQRGVQLQRLRRIAQFARPQYESDHHTADF
jgi:hypothetical protein